VIFDLHSHSFFSDGRLSPEAVVGRAAAQGVSVLAITDHDTIAGLAFAHKAAQEVGIQLINGIEFSGSWGKGGVHIVGLGVDVDSPILIDAIELQTRARDQRAEAIAARLAKAGVADALEGAQQFADGGAIGRPHFAQYLVAIGAVKNFNAAFKKYLGAGKLADVKYQWPVMAQIIGWIHAAGGRAVLAHPAKYDLTRTKMCAMISDFTLAGGDAIEVVSGAQASSLTDDLARIANKHNLHASCGSDFHFPDQPWQELGKFSPLPQGIRPVWELLGYN
jgi:3',5'-nucleoside bisphosphate phosphatase